jgi:biotin transporter BioY
MGEQTGNKRNRRSFVFRRLLPKSALRLAVLTGLSSLVVIYMIGYIVQSFVLSRSKAAIDAHLFWLEYVAGPLAAATLSGVLLSKTRNAGNISPLRTIIVIAATPLVALCTLLVMWMVLPSFYNGHYTQAVIRLFFALAYSSAVVTVRWSVNLTLRIHKDSRGGQSNPT